jgi:hypothetical protein
LLTRLSAPQNQKFANLAQILRRARQKTVQFRDGLRSQFARELVRFRQTEKRGISSLLLRLILAGSLAQRRGRLFHIENIVGHLKRPADLIAEASNAPDDRPRMAPPAIAPETTEARISAAVFDR